MRQALKEAPQPLLPPWPATKPLVLDVPFPPSVNKYWRHVRVGKDIRALVSAEGRKFKAIASWRIKSCLPPDWRPYEGDVFVRVELRPPDNHKRDLDNFLKALLDAMTDAKVWKDDSQVAELHVFWGENGGKAIVEIQPLMAGEEFPRLKQTA